MTNSRDLTVGRKTSCFLPVFKEHQRTILVSLIQLLGLLSRANELDLLKVNRRRVLIQITGCSLEYCSWNKQIKSHAKKYQNPLYFTDKSHSEPKRSLKLSNWDLSISYNNFTALISNQMKRAHLQPFLSLLGELFNTARKLLSCKPAKLNKPNSV